MQALAEQVCRLMCFRPQSLKIVKKRKVLQLSSSVPFPALASHKRAMLALHLPDMEGEQA
jgi:hypothetical protein